MAILISSKCCLKASPPTPTLSSSNSKQAPPQDAWDGKWRKQCVLVGVACSMVIGLQVSHLNESNVAIAKEITSVIANESNYKDSRGVARWSDKRRCPPWHVNSLETIVPENLPRPSSAHKRWEAIGFSQNAPPPALKVTTTGITTCFSM